jgi:D-3-phosphoglycerate dehydrogenase
MTKRILISTSSFGKEDRTPLTLLENAGFNVQLNPHGRQLTIEESKLLLNEIDGLIAGTEKLNGEVLNGNDQLKYIVRLGAGMDNVDSNVTGQLNITLENTPDAHVDGVAELTVGGILASLRGMARSDREIRSGNWVKPMGKLLKGSTVGLIGFGRISKALVKLLAPFNCKILACDPYFDVDFASSCGVKNVSVEDILKTSDIISLHLPFSEQNRNVLDEPAFSLMKKDALIVNTSRGGLIDEDALFKFLSANKGAGAYLDVFENEPYSGPLVALENMLITGHIGTYAREVRLNMELDAAKKIISYFNDHE